MGTYIQRSKACIAAMLLAFAFACGLVLAPQAYAADESTGGGDSSLQAGELGSTSALAAFDYEGDSINFIKADGTGFGMFAPQEGTTVAYENGKIKVTYVPKNVTVYAGFYLNADISDTSTWNTDEYKEFNKDTGKYEFELDPSYCGKAWPVAVVKPDGSTTSAQQYLAVPSFDKLFKDGTYSVSLNNSFIMFKISGHNSELVAEPTLVIHGDDAFLVINYRSSKGSAWRYWQLAWGDRDTVVASGADGRYGAPMFAEGKSAADGLSDDTVYYVSFTLPIAKADLIAAVQGATAMPYTARYLPHYSDVHNNDWYQYSNGSTFTITGFQKKSESTDVLADYAGLMKQAVAVPNDLSVYTEATVAPLNEALGALTGAPKNADEQDAVDAMAKAIQDALAALELKPADYAAVEAAKAGVPADLSVYTEQTAGALGDAVAAVVEGKPITEQDAVDAMAKAIQDALAALELKADSTIALDAQSKTFNGKAQAYTGTVTKTGSTGKVTYAYYSDATCTKAVKAANVKNVGTYYVKATVAADANYKAATSAAAKLTINKATPTIALDAQSKTFNGKAQAYTGTVTKIGSTGKVTYQYYSDAKCTKAVKAANVKNAGTYYVKATVAANANYKAATSKAVKFTIAKKANTLKVVAAKATQNAKAKAATTIAAGKAFKVKKNVSKGKLTYKKVSGNAKITVSKAGKITVKKGLKKGATYTLKVKASSAATANYKVATSSVITIKVKVK